MKTRWNEAAVTTKKFWLAELFVALAVLSARAQTNVFPAEGKNAPITGQWTFSKPVVHVPTTLPLPAASTVPGGVVMISNGNSATDCTVGGGSTFVFCGSNGTIWASLGGGGGSGGALSVITDPTTPKDFNLGTNNPLSFTSAGNYTSAQWNDYLLSALGGCSPASILSGGANNLTVAIDGCAKVPNSGVSNSWTTGVGGFVENDNTCANCSQFGGPAEAVAIHGQALCNANNAGCWGLSSGVGDVAAHSGNSIYGYEDDLQINNNSTQGAGVFLSYRGNGQPTGNNFPAFVVSPSSGI